jgi:hypothetical protein
MEIPDYNCVMCNGNSEESLFHLFFDCPFSKSCWNFINIQWDTSLTPQNMLIKGRRLFNSRIFRKVIMVSGWTIRCHRNAIIFDGADISLSHWKEAFKDEFGLVIIRAKPSISTLLNNWLSSLA